MQTIATDRQKQKWLFDSAAGVMSLLCRNLSVQRVSTCGVQCCVVHTTGEELEQIVFRVRELCSDVLLSFITFVFIYIVPNYNTKFSAGLTVYYDLFFLSWWRNYILCWAFLIKLVRNVSNDPRTTDTCEWLNQVLKCGLKEDYYHIHAQKLIVRITKKMSVTENILWKAKMSININLS